MKKLNMFMGLLLLVVTASVSTQAQQSKITYMDEGSKLVSYPQVKWLKGEPVTSFQNNKIYIVELWATWCTPCLAAMPHLNALYSKFKDKNVIIIAQDVMENDQARVEKFVQQKGDEMSFPVAFGGDKGSDFYNKWILAAGITDIPQTFIIQNNTLLWQTSPGMLNNEVLQLLIDGKFTIEAAKATVHINK